jgi:hypothetical protein
MERHRSRNPASRPDVGGDNRRIRYRDRVGPDHRANQLEFRAAFGAGGKVALDSCVLFGTQPPRRIHRQQVAHYAVWAITHRHREPP